MRLTQLARLSVAVVAVGGGVCCSGAEGEQVNRVSVPLGAPFDCREPIERLDELPNGYRAVLDVVAVPKGDVLQRGRVGPDNDLGSARAFSKFGLLVRSGASFEIHVAPESQGNALIHWGNAGPDDPVSALAIDNCDGETAWLAYPGGIWTLEPACTSLIVLTPAESESVRLPVGAPC